MEIVTNLKKHYAAAKTKFASVRELAAKATAQKELLLAQAAETYGVSTVEELEKLHESAAARIAELDTQLRELRRKIDADLSRLERGSK